ncbi:hypothetical protein SAMN05216483_2528 [Streptomyces sp. 2131.1]|uniref:hypothetical protein n=1 Tax=Streptomyces sp. 2131.1 TaxID=1855346 RepID=UPI00089D4499|nr:hypothetical protein [Streptomyces sp. 2131.1]SEC84794.1 hypothetical protein SAMN05216483_2528 [Streptomyces sp. 2131.1]
MNPFHGPPEWEQPAGRHTPLTDPVLTVRQISRFGFVPRRLTRIDHALVFATPSGRYTTALPPIRPTRAEIISRRYTAVYEVDMGVHPVRAELSLPSRNDALQFVSVAELSWQVGDPAAFVASRHRHVPRLLLGELEQAARAVARRFPITGSTEAEAEVLRAVRARGPLGAQAGLLVTWTLRLHRDQDNIAHEQRMQSIDHAAVESVHRERRAMEHDFETTRRALVHGEQQQALALQQQKWLTELKDAELAKVDFYQRQLEQGGVRALALHLAEHPDDTRLVMQSLRQDQLSMIRAKAEMVTQLLNSDNVEGYELEGPKNLALRALHDILNHQLPADETGRGAPAPRLPLSSEWPEEPESPLPDVQVPVARQQPRTSPPAPDQDVYLSKDTP